MCLVVQVLVACGVGQRGLDLPDVALVVNYDVPPTPVAYARCVGRAGCGASGCGAAVTLVTPDDGHAVSPLLNVLAAAGQPPPAWLEELACSGAAADADGFSVTPAASGRLRFGTYLTGSDADAGQKSSESKGGAAQG